MELSQLQICSSPFWTHKVKQKLKYQHILSMLQLLRTPASIPHAEPVRTSSVVDSLLYWKFSYKHILNILQLLSTPASVPHAEPVLASSVVYSLLYCKFSFISDVLFDC